MYKDNFVDRDKQKNRKLGFYWCNIGTMRGYPSEWTVCHWDDMNFFWTVPIYNQHFKDEDLVEIDDRKIERAS